jgi:flavoprotein, HI0933 family
MANRVVVIGGGASGLAAAIAAAENGAAVTVLEHKDRVGKKILMTGNGKCNLTNMKEVHGKYYSSDAASLKQIYNTLVRFDAVQTRDFFQRLGLYTKEKKDGGVYPVSEQASIVLDVLRSACNRLGVTIQTDCEVISIRPEKNGGVICAKQYKQIFYDKLILATGGKAASVAGSDGSGYVLAKRLGHAIVEPLPALVQLKCKGTVFKALSGVRAQGVIRLLIDGVEMATQEGELQLTDYGISGIPVFQLSRLASRALYDQKQCEASLDFISYIFDKNNLCENKKDRDKIDCVCKNLTNNAIKHFFHKTVEEYLSGLVHKKIATVVCKQNGIASCMTVNQAGKERVWNCIKMLMDFRVQITAPNSFENAQVCCGGVPLKEVNENFASLKCEGIYIVGELLDCDGICGGFNLQWAWATGIIAGTDAAQCNAITDKKR